MRIKILLVVLLFGVLSLSVIPAETYAEAADNDTGNFITGLFEDETGNREHDSSKQKQQTLGSVEGQQKNAVKILNNNQRLFVAAVKKMIMILYKLCWMQV